MKTNLINLHLLMMFQVRTEDWFPEQGNLKLG